MKYRTKTIIVTCKISFILYSLYNFFGIVPRADLTVGQKVSFFGGAAILFYEKSKKAATVKRLSYLNVLI